MTITATHITKYPDGTLEQRVLHAEFTAENEFPNGDANQCAGISGRAVEIKMAALSLMEAILSGFTDEGAGA